MSKFIIVTDSTQATVADRNAITAYLKGRGFQVWHWLEDLWLVVNDAPPHGPDERCGCIDLMRAVSDAAPGAGDLMVFDAGDPPHTAGRIRSEGLGWLSEVWNPAVKNLGRAPDVARATDS